MVNRVKVLDEEDRHHHFTLFQKLIHVGDHIC
jgi:hypothetical protein